MLTELKAFLVAHQLQDQKLVVAVSGGIDSVVLLHLLTRCCTGEQLIVAHLNHQLRGAEADGDAAFVAQISAEMGIPCQLGSADVPALIAQYRYSIEEAARRARYRFLANVAREFGAAAILTAHHADDQAETVLMKLMRGSGLSGLSGMQPISPVPYEDDDALKLVRPLLSSTRDQIEAYSNAHTLPARFDSSNDDLSLLRNRVRQSILPQLAQDAPQLSKHLRQLSQLVSADNDLLNTLTEQSWTQLLMAQTDQSITLRRAEWQALPLSLRRRVLLHSFKRLLPTVEVGFVTLEQARQVAETGQTGAKATLPSGWQLRVGYGDLWIERVARERVADVPQWRGGEIMLRVPSQVSLGNGWVISAEMIPFNLSMLDNKDPMQAFVSSKFVDNLYLRTRQAGERVQPLGLAGRQKKMKAVMIDRKISAEQRPNWPIIASQQHALWIVDHIIDERSRISNQDAAVIWLRCQQNPNSAS